MSEYHSPISWNEVRGNFLVADDAEVRTVGLTPVAVGLGVGVTETAVLSFDTPSVMALISEASLSPNPKCVNKRLKASCYPPVLQETGG